MKDIKVKNESNISVAGVYCSDVSGRDSFWNDFTGDYDIKNCAAVKINELKRKGKKGKSSNRFNFNPRDYWSFITHAVGILFGLFATIYMIIDKWDEGRKVVISYAAFGFSIIALYAASSFYHYYNGSVEKLVRVRRLDHSVIFVLIAGSYTPVLLNTLAGSKGVIFVSVMWILAVAGSVMKVFWLNAPRWLYTSLYIIMGWAIVVSPKALFTMSRTSLLLLVAGGISYTVGAVIYIFKKPNITKSFGFHEIFHCFILLGTILQFFSIGIFL